LRSSRSYLARALLAHIEKFDLEAPLTTRRFRDFATFSLLGRRIVGGFHDGTRTWSRTGIRPGRRPWSGAGSGARPGTHSRPASVDDDLGEFPVAEYQIGATLQIGSALRELISSTPGFRGDLTNLVTPLVKVLVYEFGNRVRLGLKLPCLFVLSAFLIPLLYLSLDGFRVRADKGNRIGDDLDMSRSMRLNPRIVLKRWFANGFLSQPASVVSCQTPCRE
jgi:hypothetical protein